MRNNNNDNIDNDFTEKDAVFDVFCCTLRAIVVAGDCSSRARARASACRFFSFISLFIMVHIFVLLPIYYEPPK
jgi:hypothetical protein